MKRITGISLVVWAVWGAVCGCKDTDGQDEEKEQAMEGAVQKLNENYVDTMMLHKVVFNKQIKCNGKLRAAAKSELAMPATGLLHAIHVKNGSLVKKGALLASVDDREARRELAKAEQEMEKAEVELVDKLIGQGYDETMADVPEAILKRAKVTSGYTSAGMPCRRPGSIWSGATSMLLSQGVWPTWTANFTNSRRRSSAR